MNKSLRFIAVVACVIIVMLICRKMSGHTGLIGEDFYSPEGKQARILMLKLKNLPPGTVFVNKNGEVYLLDGKGYDVVYYSKYGIESKDSFEVARSMAAFYVPNSTGLALKERYYLLDMFAQNKQVPPDWKKFLQ